MIRVTIEMVPSGIGRPRIMHVIEIYNKVGKSLSNHRYGDYGYRISRKYTKGTTSPTWHRTGSIEDFPRAAKNAVHLLLAVLANEYKEP